MKEMGLRIYSYIAIKYYSNWKLFDFEIQRIRQVIVDNDYPLYIVDSIVKAHWMNMLKEIWQKVKLIMLSCTST